MSQALYSAVKALQTESVTIEEQNGVVFLVIFAGTFESNLGFSGLIVLEFYADFVVFGFVQRPWLALID